MAWTLGSIVPEKDFALCRIPDSSPQKNPATAAMPASASEQAAPSQKHPVVFPARSSDDRGTKRLAARSSSMASSPRQQCVNHLGTAFAIHIGAYCGLAGCLVLALVFLHQPSHNPGLIAYKAPPGTAVKSYLPSSRPDSRDVLVALPAPAAEPETTGRSLEQPDARQDAQSMPEPEPRPNATPARKPKAARESRRETAAQMSAPRPSPCIPGYDGSGAQTRWC